MRKGFTLVEVVILCAIFSLLLAIFVPSCEKAKKEADKKVKQAQYEKENSFIR